MGILSWLLLGLVAGFIARKIVPGKEPGGLIITILLGIGGAIVGGFIASFFGVGTVGGFSFGSVIIATLGAILLIWIYNKLKNRSPRTPQ